MSAQRAQAVQLPVLDLDQPRSGDAASLKKTRVLKRARVLDPDVETEGGVGDEDPCVGGDGVAEEFVEHGCRGHFEETPGGG